MAGRAASVDAACPAPAEDSVPTGSTTRGERDAYRRLRIISIVTVVAIAAIVASPGPFPAWLKVEQGVCGLIMAGIAVLANGSPPRALFATARQEGE